MTAMLNAVRVNLEAVGVRDFIVAPSWRKVVFESVSMLHLLFLLLL
jgi:hypothetical protein